jgi:hypothetical protein
MPAAYGNPTGADPYLNPMLIFQVMLALIVASNDREQHSDSLTKNSRLTNSPFFYDPSRKHIFDNRRKQEFFPDC